MSTPTPSLILHDNVFTAGAEMVVNTTNRVGAMGRGIALEFKNRFPSYFNCYAAKCRQKSYGKPGEAVIWQGSFKNQDGTSVQIADLVVKDHWRMQSCMFWTAGALIDLGTKIIKMPPGERPKTVACPVPGAACGAIGSPNPHGLAPEFNEVMTIMQQLSFLLRDASVELIVCNPKFEARPLP